MFSMKLATPEGLLQPMQNNHLRTPTADSLESNINGLDPIYSHRFCTRGHSAAPRLGALCMQQAMENDADE